MRAHARISEQSLPTRFLWDSEDVGQKTIDTPTCCGRDRPQNRHTALLIAFLGAALVAPTRHIDPPFFIYAATAEETTRTVRAAATTLSGDPCRVLQRT